MSFVTIAALALTAVFLLAPISGSAFPTGHIPSPTGPAHGPLVAISGNNTYIVWANNDTGHFNVFFAKSTDSGKTLKTTMLSAPSKGNTINYNTEISASGNHVYVTWWTNKTGLLMPVLRASNDNGNTFGKTITLNSTGVSVAVPKMK
ncbi:MAG TPA: hypothetical protein VFI73_03175 [Candidatus Nitrosopolaris sp.]|nr:hypothetical protein [Candidatus Nitrosopolaris sp.]